MNLSPKAQAIERDFQKARASANYAAFPEFARRYVKHNKDGVGKLIVLDRVACFFDTSIRASAKNKKSTQPLRPPSKGFRATCSGCLLNNQQRRRWGGAAPALI